MDIEEYLNKKKELQRIIYEIIGSTEAVNCEKIVNIYETQKYRENKEEFKSFLYLITRIYENYHRNSAFQSKMEQIFLMIEQDIKQILSNYEIFDIFQENKKILLFFIQRNILIFDQYLSKRIVDDYSLCLFFFPEIRPFISKEKVQLFEKQLETENFEEKRQEGENDSKLCQLIRNDSIEEFITLLNQKNILPTSTIKPSIFETNPFLIDKEPTLIEYASFYGSIQIFKYLQMNKAVLTSSLWIYAIHSQNAELIQILEDNKVQYPDGNVHKCIYESIKCHHNDFANYFIDNNKISEQFFQEEEYYQSCFHYRNYIFFPSNFQCESIFNCLCQFDYFELLNIAFNDKNLSYQSYFEMQMNNNEHFKDLFIKNEFDYQDDIIEHILFDFFK